jgi:hypothetical protein
VLSGSYAFVATERTKQIGPATWLSTGTLWARTGADGSTIAIRDLTSGKVERTLAVPPGTTGLTVALGAAWVVNPGIVISTAPPWARSNGSTG